MGAELFHGDGRTGRRTDEQTDKTKLIVVFVILQTRLNRESKDIMCSGMPHLVEWYTAI
jgi:hypothetical protein